MRTTEAQRAEQLARLTAWIDEQGMSLADFCREVGLRYHAVYRALKIRRRVPASIKWAMLQRYGRKLTDELFGCSEPRRPEKIR